MSEEAPRHETLPALTSAPPYPPPAARLAPWLAGAAALGVLLLAGFVWHDGQRLDETRHELARRLSEGENAQKALEAQLKHNREALEALQAKLGALEARQAEMQSQQMALDALYQEWSRSREDRLLAEIEQDIGVAAQQLTLAGNVEAALIALSSAEARLAKNAQPQFLPLRKLISRDIERLKSLPGADVAGIAFKLDGILDALPHLPLAFEQRPAPAKPEKRAKPGEAGAGHAVLPAPTLQARSGAAASGAPDTAAAAGSALTDWLRAWGGELWRELRQLVRIERIDRPDPGLLAPREVFFLRENLRLRLLSARIALLARDGRSFKSDVDQAAAWLETYFDTSAPAVREAQATLKHLARLDVLRAPAELNETLSALRNFKRSRERR
ncbi:MAG: uroporphyrinogen-III C-methyltransferase [Rhodocyclaceae bacterium]|nr:uroporphyrinogen-III C-methyltransferase [Rhodocyclaceae bacterium]